VGTVIGSSPSLAAGKADINVLLLLQENKPIYQLHGNGSMSGICYTHDMSPSHALLVESIDDWIFAKTLGFPEMVRQLGIHSVPTRDYM
jgi:hypothetical protein